MRIGPAWIVIGLIALGVFIVLGVWWLIGFLWWVWLTTISWLAGIFNYSISDTEAFALLIFFIVFFPGLALLRNGNFIKINYSKGSVG